jgi:hypothetical protein
LVGQQSIPSHFSPDGYFFRGQRDDENRFSGPSQHGTGHASEKCLPKEPFPVTSENDYIAFLFVGRFQYFFRRIAYLDEGLGDEGKAS